MTRDNRDLQTDYEAVRNDIVLDLLDLVASPATTDEDRLEIYRQMGIDVDGLDALDRIGDALGLQTPSDEDDSDFFQGKGKR